METFPQYSPERISPPTRDAVVESLRANPQDYSLLDKYREVKERDMSTADDTLNYNFEEALILRDAGLLEAARRGLEDVIEFAHQLGNDSMKQKAVEELKLLS